MYVNVKFIYRTVIVTAYRLTLIELCAFCRAVNLIFLFYLQFVSIHFHFFFFAALYNSLIIKLYRFVDIVHDSWWSLISQFMTISPLKSIWNTFYKACYSLTFQISAISLLFSLDQRKRWIESVWYPGLI